MDAASLAKCASSELGIALAAAATGKSPFLKALTMARAVLDAGTCLTAAHDAAAERNAENYCHGLGGVVTNVTAEKVVCEVRERAK